MLHFFSALFEPCPINSEMQPPFTNMPINQIRQILAQEQELTKEVVEKCASGETVLNLKATRSKAIRNYKTAEHKALVSIARDEKTVKESARKAKGEYHKLISYRGGFFG